MWSRTLGSLKHSEEGNTTDLARNSMLLGFHNANAQELLKSRGDSSEDLSLPEAPGQRDMAPASFNRTYDDDGALNYDSDFDINMFLQSDRIEEEMDSTTFFSQAAIEQDAMPEVAPIVWSPSDIYMERASHIGTSNSSTFEENESATTNAGITSLGCTRPSESTVLTLQSSENEGLGERLAMSEAASAPLRTVISVSEETPSSTRQTRKRMQACSRKMKNDNAIFEQLMVSEMAKMQMPDGTSTPEGAMRLLNHVEIDDIARKPVELVYSRLTYLLIGSAYSFVAFQQTIRAARKNILLNTHLSDPNLSSAEYLQTIEALSD